MKPVERVPSEDHLAGIYDEAGTVQQAGEVGRAGTGYYGYVIVKKQCADHVRSLAHELAHVLGADHRRSELKPGSGRLVLQFLGEQADVAYGYVNDDGHVTVEVAERALRSRRAESVSSVAAGWGDARNDSARAMNLLAPILAARTPPVCTSALR
jgi:hypothetical protein